MLKKTTHIHFIGIGGIGMSGLAKILKLMGYQVSGCDTDPEQKTVKELQNLGCLISDGHNGTICNSKNIDILVHTTAVNMSNPEIINAKARGVSVIHRSLMLAELMRTKFSIAVAGSHGKTTTTSLISHILIEALLDPTIIIGGYLKNSLNNSSENARLGKSDILIAEADESDRSFLNLNYCRAIVTNIDLEHLETYKDLNDIKADFIKFLNKLPFYGKAVLCIDDSEVKSIIPEINLIANQIITYGIESSIYSGYSESGMSNIYAKDIELYDMHSKFNLVQNNNFLGEIYLNIPGKHNILNSLAAIAICLDMEVPIKAIQEALRTFAGTERRFSFNGLYKGAEIFDDYGHHPNEILQTLIVARKKAKGKLNVIFQPHRYTRTDKLWNQFIEVFVNNKVDNLIITDIYPASEKPIAGITAENLVKAIKDINPSYPVTYSALSYQTEDIFENIIHQLENSVKKNDLLLLLGAGKVNQIALQLIQKSS